MRRITPLLFLLALGCAPEGEFDPEDHVEEGALGVWRPGLTVEQAGGCSTSIVSGLSQQLIEELNCLRPNTLVDYSGANIGNNAAVWPYLQPAARDGLRRAVDARGARVQIASALRTLPQQFLLYRWYTQGRCGISLAARPGRSRHESGLALDVQDNAAWRASLSNAGWRWLGASDPPHFDYVAGGTVNLAGLSVQAFQRLWNRNHPEDRIDEDGAYGPQTEARLLRSPTEGFAVGACVQVPEPEPDPDLGPPPDPGEQLPDLTVLSRWTTIPGQARDLVTTGQSEGVFDVLVGQRFEGTVEVANGGAGPARAVVVGYALTDAFLAPVEAVIERRAGEQWVPLGAAPVAALAHVELGDVPPGEARRVRLVLDAREAAPGVYAHLRGWVVSAGTWYGEQRDWDDEVERNGAGRVLRHEGLADVFGVDRWVWPGPGADDTRGWVACDGGALTVEPRSGALVVAGGCAVSPPWTAIEGNNLPAVELEVATGAEVLSLSWGDEGIEVPLGGSGRRESHRPTVGWLDRVGPVQVSADDAFSLYAFAAAPLEPPPPMDAGVFEPEDEGVSRPRLDAGVGPRLDARVPGRDAGEVPLGTGAGGAGTGSAGCRQDGGAPLGWLALGLLVGLRRRRRAAA
ncbi:MAG: D-alanyl-D-alanine carboxypeptidase family protein [Myxococcales bacterium]|nr:D-alanyl-D-alanine carboxypeptidase family protein [Myxococcales bacterium]